MSKRISMPRWLTRWTGLLLVVGAVILFGSDIANSTRAAAPEFLMVEDVYRFGVGMVDHLWVWAVSLIMGAALVAVAGRVRRERMIFFH